MRYTILNILYYTELFYSVQRFISERLFKTQKEGERTDFDAIIEEYGRDGL